eukprot:GHVS01094570.1.p1 GENE.GHVS01094570.1~~GHVS01094570.1.p1  ORF type:complete len:235 (+),score=39.33 GHVS01094570.1:186-890(+)
MLTGYFGSELIAQEHTHKCSRPYQPMYLCSLRCPPTLPSFPVVSSYSDTLASANAQIQKHKQRLLDLQVALREEACCRQVVEEAKHLSLELERQESASRSPLSDNVQEDNVTRMKSLTGATEDNCILYLRKCHNNLEAACQKFYDERERRTNTTTVEFVLPNGNTVRETIELTKTIWDMKVLAYNQLSDKSRGFKMFHQNRCFLDSDYSLPIRLLGFDASNTFTVRVAYNDNNS